MLKNRPLFTPGCKQPLDILIHPYFVNNDLWIKLIESSNFYLIKFTGWLIKINFLE